METETDIGKGNIAQVLEAPFQFSDSETAGTVEPSVCVCVCVDLCVGVGVSVCAHACA